mgnify:FL=1
MNKHAALVAAPFLRFRSAVLCLNAFYKHFRINLITGNTFGLLPGYQNFSSSFFRLKPFNFPRHQFYRCRFGSCLHLCRTICACTEHADLINVSFSCFHRLVHIRFISRRTIRNPRNFCKITFLAFSKNDGILCLSALRPCNRNLF